MLRMATVKNGVSLASSPFPSGSARAHVYLLESTGLFFEPLVPPLDGTTLALHTESSPRTT